MRPEQEPKYDAVSILGSEPRLFNRATGEAIPDDEPVFIFRARDKHAVQVLNYFQGLCAYPKQREIVAQRVQDFMRFAIAHPERMKEPDSPA